MISMYIVLGIEKDWLKAIIMIICVLILFGWFWRDIRPAYIG